MPIESSDSREIRVFISSTFRDMQEDRDYLVKHIFPQLRRLCDARGVTWGQVDLRWGITDEEAAEGKVLPLCLAEIERSRPYFIGLLGERYGWVPKPEEIPGDLLEREPWMKDHLTCSVTELEIIHGVLREEQMHRRAFFYVRDPDYLDRLPRGRKRVDFESESPEADAKLNRMKQRIRAASREQVCQLRENYHDPPQLGQWILEDFTQLIDRLYPEDEQHHPLDRESALHEAFARNRTAVYIGRKVYFDQLDQHAAGTGESLVVLGETGSGKSALLANWAAAYRGSHPADIVLLHFVGASTDSSDWTSMLRRIMGEFKRRFEIDQELPDQPDLLLSSFANWLHMASAQSGKQGRRIVLVICAVDQLEDRNGAPDLIWLPPVIPKNVRLILSTLSGRPLDAVKRRGWPTLTIEPLTAEERRLLVRDYLGQHTKRLSDDRTRRIVDCPQTAKPLFLRVLLEELRVFGIHEQLDERIGRYLQAETTHELYQRVLERYERDYGTDLVRNAMSLIWASRNGLSEAELLDLLGHGGQPFPQSQWAPLHLAIEQSLINRSGLVGFFHEHLRQAVTDRYMFIHSRRHATRRQLLGYYRQALGKLVIGKDWRAAQRKTQRLFEELPWQLAQLEEWRELSGVLSDPGCLPLLWISSDLDVRRYWAQIEQNSPLRAKEVYRPVIETPGVHKADHVRSVAQLLTVMGHLDAGVQLYQHLGQRDETRGEPNIDWTVSQAQALCEQGKAADAIALLAELEQLCRKSGDASLDRVVMAHGNALGANRQFEQALEKYREQEQLSEKLGHKGYVALSLGNQGVAMRDQMFGVEEFDIETVDDAWLERQKARRDEAKLDRALELHRREERIYLELGDEDGLQRSLGNQATILATRGNHTEAIELLERKELICRETGNKYSLVMCLVSEAHIWAMHLGDPQRGFRQAVEACDIVAAHNVIRGRHAARQSLTIAFAAYFTRLHERRQSPEELLPQLEECYAAVKKYGLSYAPAVASALTAVRVAIKRQRILKSHGLAASPDCEVVIPIEKLKDRQFIQQWTHVDGGDEPTDESEEKADDGVRPRKKPVIVILLVLVSLAAVALAAGFWNSWLWLMSAPVLFAIALYLVLLLIFSYSRKASLALGLHLRQQRAVAELARNPELLSNAVDSAREADRKVQQLFAAGSGLGGTEFKESLRLRREAVLLIDMAGNQLADSNRIDEATECYRQAVKLRDEMLGRQPFDPDLCWHHIAALDELGMTLVESGDAGEGWAMIQLAQAQVARMDRLPPGSWPKYKHIRRDVFRHAAKRPQGADNIVGSALPIAVVELAPQTPQAAQEAPAPIPQDKLAQEAKSLRRSASDDLQAENLTSARDKLHESLEISSSIGDSVGEAESWHDLAEIDLKQRDYKAARAKAQRLLDIMSKERDERGESAAYHQMGSIELYEGDLPSARKMLERAMEIRQRIGDRTGEWTTWHQLAMIELGEKNLKTAAERFRKVLEIAQAIDDQTGEMAAFAGLGATASLMGRTEDAFCLTGLAFLISGASLNHAETEAVARQLTKLGIDLSYDEEQFQAVLLHVAREGRSDRGRGLVERAFSS